MLNSGWDTQIRSGILGLTESDIKDSQDWTPRFSRPDSESCTWTPRIKNPDSDSQRYHLQLLVAPLAPLWLPWGCLEVPWGTPVAPLELPGGPMGHLCGSLGAAWRSHGAPLWLPWGILGASLAQEDFEGKTSKLAKASSKTEVAELKTRAPAPFFQKA